MQLKVVILHVNLIPLQWVITERVRGQQEEDVDLFDEVFVKYPMFSQVGNVIYTLHYLA